jgi:hypothetical protein
MCVHLSIYLSFCLIVSPLVRHLPVGLPAWRVDGLTARLPARLLARLPAVMPARLPAHISAHLPARLPVRLPSCLPADLPYHHIYQFWSGTFYLNFGPAQLRLMKNLH